MKRFSVVVLNRQNTLRLPLKIRTINYNSVPAYPAD